MRFIQGALLVCALGASTVLAGEPSSEVRQQVLDTEKQWVNAVLKPDQSALDRLLVDDIVYSHSTGQIQTKAQFIDSVVSGSTRYEAIDFTDTKIRQYGETVIVNHKAVFKTVPNGVSNLFLTMVWVRQGDAWKLATRQASKLQ